jgi:beta-glucosidase-like glycosyl hydrolase
MQVMVPFNYTEFINELTSQVMKNIIPMSRIDDAVYRILRVKFTMGLFENPFADLSLADELGKQVCSEQLIFFLSNSHFMLIDSSILTDVFPSAGRNTENLLGKLSGNPWCC